MSTPTQAPAGPTVVSPIETVTAAAHAVQKLSFTDQVEYLLTSVGPRITAAGAGLRDARQLPAWRKGDVPREDVKKDRVAHLAEITKAITEVYPAAVAASFLRSSQPALDDRSPMMMIRNAEEGDLPEIMGEVRGAVRAFLAG